MNNKIESHRVRYHTPPIIALRRHKRLDILSWRPAWATWQVPGQSQKQRVWVWALQDSQGAPPPLRLGFPFLGLVFPLDLWKCLLKKPPKDDQSALPQALLGRLEVVFIKTGVRQRIHTCTLLWAKEERESSKKKKVSKQAGGKVKHSKQNSIPPWLLPQFLLSGSDHEFLSWLPQW